MIRRRPLLACLLTVAIGFVFGAPLLAQDKPPRKYALLVGVQNYPRGVLGNLKHTENDVDELADWLKAKGGYDVVSVMTQTRAAKQAELFPSSDNITSNLKELLKLVRRGDHVLVAFSGHGVQLRVKRGDKEEVQPFFCPADVKHDDDKRFRNLVGLKEVYDALEESNASVKLLVVDACREHKGDRGAGEEFAPLDPPKGIAAFFSCGSNEKSFEFEDDSQPKHGIFFHHLLAGLSGKAANAKGEVTLELLADYVKREVPIDVKRTISVRARQNPNVKADFTGTPLVMATVSANRESTSSSANEPRPGDEMDLDLGQSVKLRLCWIPGGKFTMGSPKEEQDYVTWTYFKGNRPAFLDYEKEHQVEVGGFWMSKFHVTQQQYIAVGGKNNPSHFSSKGAGKTKVLEMNTNDFPVESVRWNEAQEWIRELNRKITDKSVKVPARWEHWKASLPSEAQWERAARGGRGNGHPFYWGDELNGTQANCNGTAPYGTDTKGPRLGRTTKVGSYGQAIPHPWGLCDMSGNVSSWCEDYYGRYESVPAKKDPVQSVRQGEDYRRVLRGGSFGHAPWLCRSANRGRDAPNQRYDEVGFRVVLRLE